MTAPRAWRRRKHVLDGGALLLWWRCETDESWFAESDDPNAEWSFDGASQVAGGRGVWSNGARSFVAETGVELM
eukprot:6185078-Alexandrium_andersonii.AAC.1